MLSATLALYSHLITIFHKCKFILKTIYLESEECKTKEIISIYSVCYVKCKSITSMRQV